MAKDSLPLILCHSAASTRGQNLPLPRNEASKDKDDEYSSPQQVQRIIGSFSSNTFHVRSKKL